MSAFAEDIDRSLLPRWRSTRSTTCASEFDGDPAGRGEFAPNPLVLLEKLSEWKHSGGLALAADVVACGVTTAQLDLVQDAAEFLLRRKDDVTPHVARLAKRALMVSEGVDDDIALPFLPNRESANAEIRSAKARVRRDPRNALAYIDLARGYAILGQSFHAGAAMSAALAQAPHHRRALRVAARLYVHMGEPDRAFSLLARNERTRTDPWLLATFIALAGLADKSPRFVREARGLVEQRWFSPADLTELYAALATLDLRSGRSVKARQGFRKSLIAPNDNVIAQARWVSKRVSGVNVEEAILKVPASYEAWSWLALENAEWERASRYCAQWLGDEPFSSRPAVLGSYIGISVIKDPIFSEECAAVGLRAHPDDATLLNNLTVALAYQGRIEEAEATFSKIELAESDDYPDYVHAATTGLLNFKRNRAGNGRAWYERAEEMAPKERKGRVLIYRAREEAGVNLQVARNLATRARAQVERYPDAHAARLIESFFEHPVSAPAIGSGVSRIVRS
jgi:tetratricopeptide (TPR) repeat protein